jgi:hypothetical protein
VDVDAHVWWLEVGVNRFSEPLHKYTRGVIELARVMLPSAG